MIGVIGRLLQARSNQEPDARSYCHLKLFADFSFQSSCPTHRHFQKLRESDWGGGGRA